MSNVSLAQGQVGSTYSQPLVSSLSPPVIWNFISGNRPPGLTLNSMGVLSGVPSTAGQFQFEAEASNMSSTMNLMVTVTIQPSTEEDNEQKEPKTIFNEWWFWAIGVVVLLLIVISIFFVVRNY